jgi:hypothetical protein
MWQYLACFIVLLQEGMCGCFSVNQLSLRMCHMSCPIYIVTAKNRSMSDIVASARGENEDGLSSGESEYCQ